ncbi:MAG TPA: lipid-A-disaccharide synthase [Thermoanaerobaculia bacterium]|nr:lipid-A-disaccharide synthase [Thermoanaerobaculia bacterium]
MGPERTAMLVVAGEASGDLHGARLIEELRGLVDGVEAFGLGGEHLAAAGLDRLADSAEISVVGLTEAFRILPRARRIFDRILAEVDRRRPRLALLIDFPEFNLRLARALRDRGIPVVYYISPQVWAWRRGRVRTVSELVDAMLVLFPFEAEFYRRHGVEAVHVGHPLVDEIPELPHVWDQGEPESEPYQIALLPGSRANEVEALLPVMLDTVRRLADEIPVFARLIRAPTIPLAMVEEALDLEGLPVRIVPAADRAEAIASSHFALCASGTATLEVGLLGTPMAVLYRLGGWTYLAGRLMVRLPYVSLVNLVLGRLVVPELLQARAHPKRVSGTVLSLLRDRPAIEEMRRGLGELRGRLGEKGASARAAAEVAARLRVEVPAR